MSWKSWHELRMTATAWKHHGRLKLRAARRDARPPAQPETAHTAISKTTKKTPMQDKVFSCPKLTLKMQQQEADIESIMHRIKHVPRPSLNVTADQQSEIYFASIPCTQRER